MATRGSRRHGERIEEQAAAPVRPHPTRRRIPPQSPGQFEEHADADPTGSSPDLASGVATLLAFGIGAAVVGASIVPGLALGAGAVLAGRLLPPLPSAARPLLKAAIDAGFSLADQARVLAGDAGREMSQLIAEVQAERRQRQTETPGQATGEETAHAAPPMHH